MAVSVAAGVYFSLLATTELKKGSLVPTKVHLNCEDYEPSHRKYMLLCKDKVKWETGKREELNSIVENEAWMKTPVPTGTKVIPLKWAYKLKRDRLGNIIRHKCRLVAQCFFQVFGQDYTDTYSPVAKNMSIRTLLAISAQLRLQDIWVQVPQGTDLPPGDNGIYKLKKSLYGLKQTPRE